MPKEGPSPMGCEVPVVILPRWERLGVVEVGRTDVIPGVIGPQTEDGRGKSPL